MQGWTLITGASEGLGREFARIAAREGRNLILTARSEERLRSLADELSDGAGEILVLPADLGDPREAQALWRDASAERRIDILVNNAGLGRHGDFADPAGWDRELLSIDVNVTALTYLMKHAIPHMQAHGGGRILNLASVASFMPGPNMAVYHATKAYVLSLSEAVAEELRGAGITVTAICPGATATRFQDGADMHGITLARLGAPMSARDVAETGWTAAMKGRRVVVTGARNALFAALPRLAPRRLAAHLTGRIMAKR